MTQVTQKTSNEYDPSKLEAYLKLNPDTKNDVLYSVCGATTDSEKGYIRKKKSRILEKLESLESSHDKEDSDRSKVYTKKGLKQDIHDNSHAIDLIQKYPELPLFIYSKIFEKVKPQYDIMMSEAPYDDPPLNYSFSDYYTTIFESIEKGKYDREITEFMKDVVNNFGTIHSYELEQVPFTPEFGDYSYFHKWVLEIISEVVTYFLESFTSKELKAHILYYLLIKSNGEDTNFVSNIIGSRSKEIIRTDILKLFILWKKDVCIEITLEDLYNEFDKRYSDELDYKEYGINYNGEYDHLFYQDTKGEYQYKEN